MSLIINHQPFMIRSIFSNRFERFGARMDSSPAILMPRILIDQISFFKVKLLLAILLFASRLFAQNNINTWVPLEPQGTRALERVGWQKLVYDERNDKIWLFACAGGETYQAYANDVWVYDMAMNRWTMVRDISPDRDPPDRPSWRHAEQGRTFDTNLGLFVLFGQQSAAGPKNDTWTYKIATDVWTEMKPTGDVPPIPNHFEYALEYDRIAGVSVLFGGERQWSYPSDVWEYNLVQNRWKRYPFNESNAPKGRRGHSMVYCDSLGGVIIFGGTYGWSNTQDFNDTWLYKSDKHIWRRLKNENAPPARSQFSLDYDPINNICLLFSGTVRKENVSQIYDDTWIYHVTNGRWGKLALNTHPPADARGDMMVYARKHRAFFLMSKDGNIWKFKYERVVTNIIDNRASSSTYRLANNFPNPFNPSTTIYYQIPSITNNKNAHVKLRIFDTMGREIRIIVDHDQLPGEYCVEWDGKNSQGRNMPSGVYIYELLIDDLRSSKKMSLIK